MNEEQKIQVCFPLHDSSGQYSKFVGTAMCSMFLNTKNSVSVHILHDNTLAYSNKEKFIELGIQYKQEIIFHEINIDEKFLDVKFLKKYSVGTLFRLYIPEILDLSKLIYLDADVIVNMDIIELWNVDLNGNFIGACIDEPIHDKWWIHNLCVDGIFDFKTYFNAGVLILDLNYIKKTYNLIEESLKFFLEYSECKCVDQDFLNYLFKNSYYKLSQNYNTFVAGLRRSDFSGDIDKRIYHFSGDEGRAHYLRRDVFDNLWWIYFLKTPWGRGCLLEEFYEIKIKEKEKIAQWVTNAMLKITKKKKIFFGASGQLHAAIRKKLAPIIKETDYYVDNNSNIWGLKIDNLMVRSPLELSREKKAEMAIIVVTLRYVEIREYLKLMGYLEDVDFFDGRKFLTENEGGYLESCV